MGSEILPHKVGPNEDVRDLNGGDCNTRLQNKQINKKGDLFSGVT